MDAQTDNGHGYIWEWSDEAIGETDKPLIIALANAKSTKMKLIDRRFFGSRHIVNALM
jgi:hypothetical protein